MSTTVLEKGSADTDELISYTDEIVPLATPEQLRHCAQRIRLGCRHTTQGFGMLTRHDGPVIFACALGAALIGDDDPHDVAHDLSFFSMGFNACFFGVMDDDGKKIVRLGTYIIYANDVKHYSREHIADLLDHKADDLEQQEALHG